MFEFLTGKDLLKVMAIAVLALALGGCALEGKKEASPSVQRLQERAGAEVVRSIEGAKQGSVAKVLKEEGEWRVGKHPHVLTGDKVKELKKMLLDDYGYLFSKTKKCLFIPEVAFRFEGISDVQVMLSLSCNQIKFIEKGQTTILDYDPMAEQLNAFCREILEQLDKDHSNK